LQHRRREPDQVRSLRHPSSPSRTWCSPSRRGCPSHTGRVTPLSRNESRYDTGQPPTGWEDGCEPGGCRRIAAHRPCRGRPVRSSGPPGEAQPARVELVPPTNGRSHLGVVHHRRDLGLLAGRRHGREPGRDPIGLTEDGLEGGRLRRPAEDGLCGHRPVITPAIALTTQVQTLGHATSRRCISAGTDDNQGSQGLLPPWCPRNRVNSKAWGWVPLDVQKAASRAGVGALYSDGDR